MKCYISYLILFFKYLYSYFYLGILCCSIIIILPFCNNIPLFFYIFFHFNLVTNKNTASIIWWARPCNNHWIFIDNINTGTASRWLWWSWKTDYMLYYTQINKYEKCIIQLIKLPILSENMLVVLNFNKPVYEMYSFDV